MAQQIVINDKNIQTVTVTIGNTHETLAALLDAFLELYKGAPSVKLQLDAVMGIIISDTPTEDPTQPYTDTGSDYLTPVKPP